MITKDKIIEIFCIIDEFDKNLNVELGKNLCLPSYNGNGKRCRNRKGRLSESEIMTILVSIISVHVVISRSIIRTISVSSSGMNSLLPSPITVL